MTEQSHPLETLHDIKKMMERSSRFISLSGLSGIGAGVCALVGAWFANNVIAISGRMANVKYNLRQDGEISVLNYIGHPLLHIAIITFIASFILAFTFTYLRSRQHGIPLWGKTSKRLMVNVGIPLLAGGLYLLKLMTERAYGMIAPGCLIFYGLALINGAKYTLSEVRYLGYCQLVLGLVSLNFIGYGLYFWALGFGVMHILYGTIMWYKYERKHAD